MNPQLNLSEAQQASHIITPPVVKTSNTITIDQFMNLVQLRTAKVVHVELIPNKDRLYKITVQVGAETRTIVSGIREWYPNPEELVGKMVAIVSNLAPKKLGGVESQGMLLAALDDEGKFSLLVAEREVKSGAEVR
jgi:methionyl-tRNA synthetase